MLFERFFAPRDVLPEVEGPSICTIFGFFFLFVFGVDADNGDDEEPGF